MQERPNIVFVMLDTFRADYFSDYSGRRRLRVLEGIASKGTVYTFAVAPATYTAPSHASIFLGKRPMNINALLQGHRRAAEEKEGREGSEPEEETMMHYLDKGEITLANKLEYLGYKTALFSSNAFLDPSIDIVSGFSYTRGNLIRVTHRYFDIASRVLYSQAVRNVITSAIGLLSRVAGRKQTDAFFLRSIRTLGNHLNKEYGYYSLDRGADVLNQNVEEYLSDRAASSGNKFIFINYMEAHEGYPTQLVTDRYVEQDRWLYMSHVIDTKPVELLRQACWKRLEYLDGKVEELLKKLKKRGVLDNAVLIMTSDHGQAFMEHDQMYHFVFPYEQLARVPLVVARFRNGKQVAERRVVREPFSLTRLYGMIADAAYGLPMEQKGARSDEYVFCDHIGILNWWATRIFDTLKDRAPAFESMHRTLRKFDTSVTAIYHSGHKLIHFYRAPERDELYDIRGDPGERRNILASNRALARRMLDANKRSLGVKK